MTNPTRLTHSGSATMSELSPECALKRGPVRRSVEFMGSRLNAAGTRCLGCRETHPFSGPNRPNHQPQHLDLTKKPTQLVPSMGFNFTCRDLVVCSERTTVRLKSEEDRSRPMCERRKGSGTLEYLAKGGLIIGAKRSLVHFSLAGKCLEPFQYLVLRGLAHQHE